MNKIKKKKKWNINVWEQFPERETFLQLHAENSRVNTHPSVEITWIHPWISVFNSAICCWPSGGCNAMGMKLAFFIILLTSYDSSRTDLVPCDSIQFAFCTRVNRISTRGGIFSRGSAGLKWNPKFWQGKCFFPGSSSRKKIVGICDFFSYGIVLIAKRTTFVQQRSIFVEAFQSTAL